MENTPEMFHCCDSAVEREDKSRDDAKVKEPTFTPTVSGVEFYQYQMWQRGATTSLPLWFMTDDAKANDIMRHYREVEQYYN